MAKIVLTDDNGFETVFISQTPLPPVADTPVEAAPEAVAEVAPEVVATPEVAVTPAE